MSRRSKIALTILAVLVVILLALQTPLLHAARNIAWRAATIAAAALADFGPLTVSDTLQHDLATLRADNIRLAAELRDYHKLRDQLGSPAYDNLRHIPALVTHRPVDTFRTQYFINRGAKDGITLGAPVTTHGSTLVGFITDLQEHSAVLQLLLHPSTSLNAVAADNDQARGLLTGHAYTSLTLTTVPRDVTLTADQPVITTSQEHVPHGLLVGHIADIDAAENETYQQATLRLPYDPDDLRAVTVLVAP